MGDTIRLVDYFYVMVADRPGQGARALGHLKDAGVNLLSYHAFPRRRRAQLVFVPSDPAALKAAARKARWKLVGPKKAFLVEGEDRTGALVDHYAKMAWARVNVTAADALVAGGRFAAIVWVKARDVKKAAKAMGVA